MQKTSLLVAAALLDLAPAHAMPPPLPPVEGKDAATLQAEMAGGRMHEALLASLYLDRIARLDDHGPTLNAVLATFPDTEAQAKRLYIERQAGTLRGPLHGIPILLKDNIEAAGPLPTTAGSLALKDNVTNRDASICFSAASNSAAISVRSPMRSRRTPMRLPRSASGDSAAT